jgi:hypothetical protein
MDSLPKSRLLRFVERAMMLARRAVARFSTRITIFSLVCSDSRLFPNNILTVSNDAESTEQNEKANMGFTELTRFTPVLRNLRFLICERELSPRFRLSVGTLVSPGKGGILSLYQDSSLCSHSNQFLQRPSLSLSLLHPARCELIVT